MVYKSAHKTVPRQSGIALSLHSLFTHSPTANTSSIPCEVTSITTKGMKFDQCVNITKSPNIKDQYKKTHPFRMHKHYLQVVINEQTTCTTNTITSAICGRWEEWQHLLYTYYAIFQNYSGLYHEWNIHDPSLNPTHDTVYRAPKKEAQKQLKHSTITSSIQMQGRSQ